MQTIESMFINDCVLIDTWWNVNYERQKQIKRRLRF